MKIKILSLLVLSLGVGLSACGKKSTAAADDSSTDPGQVSTPKVVAGVWTVSNSAWSIDWTNANLSGTPFTMTLTMSDHVSRCTCGITANGTDAAGTCTLSTACSFMVGAGSDPGCANFSGNGFGMCAGGGYTNDGTNFEFISGATYH